MAVLPLAAGGAGAWGIASPVGVLRRADAHDLGRRGAATELGCHELHRRIDVVDERLSELDDSWNTFKSAVDDVPSDASVSDALNDVSSSAKTFASSAQSTLSGPDCS